MAKTIDFNYEIDDQLSRASVWQFRFKQKVRVGIDELLTLMTLVRVWRLRVKQRKQLAQLSDFMLKDIGISRADAEQEAIKPFWK